MPILIGLHSAYLKLDFEVSLCYISFFTGLYSWYILTVFSKVVAIVWSIFHLALLFVWFSFVTTISGFGLKESLHKGASRWSWTQFLRAKLGDTLQWFNYLSIYFIYLFIFFFYLIICFFVFIERWHKMYNDKFYNLYGIFSEFSFFICSSKLANEVMFLR